MLRFILPDRTSREDVLSFYREIEEGGGECIGIGNYRDFDRWLTGMQNRHTGENLPDGYVRENFYLCYDGDTLVERRLANKSYYKSQTQTIEANPAP